MCSIIIAHAYKNERRLLNKKSYGLKKGEHKGWYKKERRQDRDGECCELKDEDGE